MTPGERVAGLWHRLQHRMGWNTGSVVAWHIGQRLMMAYRCDKCGRLDGVHDAAHIIPEYLR